MNKFDIKRLGWGKPNPLIKKGARGYFSNYLKEIQAALEDGIENSWGVVERVLLKDPKINALHPYEYESETPLRSQFFYVLEETPTTRPFTDHELMELLGKKVIDKYGDTYDVRKFEKIPNEAGGVLLLRCKGRGFVWVAADELLDEYTFEDGSPVGKLVEEGGDE